MNADDARAHEEAIEQAVTELLERRLPQHPASLALKRRLAAMWPPAPSARKVVARPWWRQWGALAPVAGGAIVLLFVAPLYYERTTAARATASLVTEAVNDHLRIVSNERPLGVESDGLHQVKPWFTGRLDFAPIVGFAGDEGFPLRGGAVEYFLDRRAAVFVYGRRLHTASLFVIRAEGLPWPSRPLERLGAARAYTTTARGFHVVLWRTDELGYALVSDLELPELRELASKIARSP